MPSRVLLFAPGAGAPSTSAWMLAWAKRLGALGDVSAFDYQYQRNKKKSPDRPPVLLSTHRAEIERVRTEHPTGPLVLLGKSMGGRIGCHVAVEQLQSGAPEAQQPAALVCLGYPLVAPGGAVRDQVLLDLRTPVLFVQGTRDPMCPLDRLASVREHMQTPTALHIVEGGDHSLLVLKGALAKQGLTQDGVDERILAAITTFLAEHAPV